jgi:hypothetical protein
MTSTQVIFWQALSKLGSWLYLQIIASVMPTRDSRWHDLYVFSVGSRNKSFYNKRPLPTNNVIWFFLPVSNNWRIVDYQKQNRLSKKTLSART